MDKVDMCQSRFGKIDEFGWWNLERISADAGSQFTSTEFQDECQTLRCLYYFSISVSSRNEWTSQGDMKNVSYDPTPTYGTCASFGKLYPFCINVYDISYFPGTTIQRLNKIRHRSDHIIQTYNSYKTCNIIFTRVILTMCCT